MSEAGDKFVWKALFGGAIELRIPEPFTDVSDFRPVPDNQEVFADGSTDQSIIVEIMEHSTAAARSPTVAEFYFQDLSEQNDASSVTLLSSVILGKEAAPRLPPNLNISIATGQQCISKSSQAGEANNLVLLLVGVIEMPHVNSDVVITLNIPQYISERSAAAEHAGPGHKQDSEAASSMFNALLQSLVIKKWTLFSGDENPGGADEA